MKHLTQYINEGIFDDKGSLNEGIFDDNVNSAIKLNGITIDDSKWKLCVDYYQKRRKKYFGNMSKVSLGDMYEKYNVVYNEDDCIVAIGEDFGDFDVYVLCPETIYMCHEVAEINGHRGHPYTFSLTDIDEANDFDISFNWYQDSRQGWMWISGTHSGILVKKMKEVGFESLIGYIPRTISKKARDIIKKYTS